MLSTTLVVAEHDQGAGAAAQDPLQAVAQLGAGRDRGQRGAQQLVVGCVAGTVLLARSVARTGRRGPPAGSVRSLAGARVHAAADRVARAVRHRSARRSDQLDGCAAATGRGDVAGLDDPHAVGQRGPPRRRPGGHEGVGEAEPGGLGQPAGDAGDRADLAGQADLAERDGAAAAAARSSTALGDRQRDRQVGGRLGEPDAADRRRRRRRACRPARRPGARARRAPSRPGCASSPRVVRRGVGQRRSARPAPAPRRPAAGAPRG